MRPVGISHIGTLRSTRQDAAISTRNGLIKDKIINEKGFTLLTDKLPYQFLGKIETDTHPIVFSGDGEFSAIGFLDLENNSYRSILDDKVLPYKLNFDPFKFIQGEFRRNFLNQIDIVWIEEGKKPRFLNTEAEIPSSVEMFDLCLYAKMPNITLDTMEGGSLEKGAYYVTVKMITKEEATTSPFTLQGPIFIHNEKPTAGVDYPSGMALKIKVRDLDTKYDKFKFVIVRNVNGVISALETDSFPVTPGEFTYTHSTNERGTTIAIEEVLIPEAVYTEASSITQIDDTLYLGGVKEEKEDILQEYFNHASVKWVSELVDIEDPDLKSGKKRTFKHGEVYALYGVVRWKNGRKSKAFHIPGPEESYTILTSRDLGGKTVNYKSSIEGYWDVFGGREGFTAGWKNISEKYPNESYYGALKNTPVRHHRMPTIRFCKETLYSDVEEYGVSKLDILGLRVTGIQFPEEVQRRVASIEIYYAKRDYGNSLVMSQGVMVPSTISFNAFWTGESTAIGAYEKVEDEYLDKLSKEESFTNSPFFNGTSFMYDIDKREGHVVNYWLSPFSLVNAVHSPETIKDRFIISGTPTVHLQGWLKTYVAKGGETGASFRGGVRKVVNHIKESSWTIPTTSGIAFGESSEYLINGEKDTYTNNNKSETKLVLNTAEYHEEIESPWKNHLTGRGVSLQNTPEYLGVVDIIGSTERDLYPGFTSQQLVRAGKLTNTVVFGGDTFICKFGFNTMGVGEFEKLEWEVNEDKTPIDKKTNQFYRQVIIESNKNLWLRYVDIQNPLDKYYNANIKTDPKVDEPYFLDGDEPNTISLPLGNNALADLLDGIYPFNPWDKDVTESPFKIVRSRRQSREGKKNSWRVFLALDYFETVKNKGRITNLEGYDGNLFIHHESALFRTANKTTLSGDILSVTLGSGDIFKLEPQEFKASKTGVAGLQHPLYSTVCDAGYIFFDSERGTVFLANDKGLSPLNGELDQTIQLLAKGIKGNPYTANRGCVIGYDPEENRVILSFLKIHEFLTLSLDIGTMRWASSHDYAPSAFVATRNKLIGVHNNKFYKFNAGAPGVYHDATKNPYIQDVAFVKGASFILDNVNWKSTVRVEDNSLVFPEEIHNETFTSAAVYSVDTCSGDIPLVVSSSYNLRVKHNLAKSEDTWNFNKFDDIKVGSPFIGNFIDGLPIDSSKLDPRLPWHKRGKIRGDVVVVKLTYDNTSGKRIILDDLDIKLTPLSR